MDAGIIFVASLSGSQMEIGFNKSTTFVMSTFSVNENIQPQSATSITIAFPTTCQWIELNTRSASMEHRVLRTTESPKTLYQKRNAKSHIPSEKPVGNPSYIVLFPSPPDHCACCLKQPKSWLLLASLKDGCWMLVMARSPLHLLYDLALKSFSSATRTYLRTETCTEREGERGGFTI
jgi:hypothetical protein